MQEPSQSAYSGEFQAEGSQWIGCGLDVSAATGENVYFGTSGNVDRANYSNNSVRDNAQAHFGDNHYHGAVISQSPPVWN